MGARIWQLISDGKSLREVCDVMVDEYEVSREVLELDISRLLHELSAQGLILSS